MGWTSKVVGAARHLQAKPPTDDADASDNIQAEIIEDKNSDNPASTAAAAEGLKRLEQTHEWDPNLPQEKVDAIEHARRTGDVEAVKEVGQSLTEDSPYPEVRAAVRNTDGEEVANTVRAWILGLFFVTIGGGLNMFLSMRWATDYGEEAGRNHTMAVLMMRLLGAQQSLFLP